MCQFRLLGKRRLLHLFLRNSLPVAEVLVNLSNHFVRVEVASHTDSSIVWHIPLLEVVLDIGDAGILQVSLRADGGLCTVWMRGKQLVHQGVVHLLAVVGQIDVILLIDCLQLRMESTDGHVLETIGLNLQPRIHLVGGNILDIASTVVPGVGIGTLGTYHRHELVVLVRNEILGSQL